MPRVLVVEDDRAVRELVVEELEEQGFTVSSAADAEAALAALEGSPIDVLVTDLNLSRDSGISLARQALARDPELPVIIITAFGSLETAVDAIRAGAYDFLTKPLSLEALALAVERAAGLRTLKQELASLRVDVRKQGRRSRLDGTSPAISRLRDHIATVAATDATVMLLGESGAGKELVARDLHELSRRSERPFVAENLAAIPADLLESTLFGHVRGAFTGATAARTGLFRMAHGGTLLLDEIGELPLELQPKLLRVLEQRRVRPVGADREIDIDVRLIAATHRDLEEAVREGHFREDLFYRLAVFELAVPPLRERGSDVLLLAQLFIEEHARALGRPPPRLHHDTAAVLLAWSWPGNVRELKNAMERAVVLAADGVVLPRHLPARMAEAPAPAAPPAPEAEADVLLTLDEVERRHILAVLRAHGGNKAEAARALGIGRKTLYRKLEAWGLGRNDTAETD